MTLTRDGQTYYYHTNAHGDIIALTDSSGNVVARYKYDPWGKILSITDANGDPITDPNHIANLNPYRYAGYRYDRETGLYYLQTRYYKPGIYRFLTKDPDGGDLEDPLSLNPYVYCNDDPINHIDPDGKKFWKYLALGGVVLVIIGAFYLAIPLAPTVPGIILVFAGGAIAGVEITGWALSSRRKRKKRKRYIWYRTCLNYRKRKKRYRYA